MFIRNTDKFSTYLLAQPRLCINLGLQSIDSTDNLDNNFFSKILLDLKTDIMKGFTFH